MLLSQEEHSKEITEIINEKGNYIWHEGKVKGKRYQ